MTRALVLGGGGSVGVAWESGLVAGFAQAGVDLGDADLILGTSAGAIVGARLAAGVAPARLAESQLVTAPAAAAPPPTASPEIIARTGVLLKEALGGTGKPAEARRALGALALSAPVMGEAEYLDLIGRELGEVAGLGWPARDFACTAIDAADGGFQLWRAESGVALLPAVTSSCSVPGRAPPISLGGGRYFDGVARSGTNADIAAGHDLVVIVAVHPPGFPEWLRRGLAEEAEMLKSTGATVVVITPDDAAGVALGANLMDVARKPDAARAGLAQAAAQAAVLREVWG